MQAFRMVKFTIPRTFRFSEFQTLPILGLAKPITSLLAASRLARGYNSKFEREPSKVGSCQKWMMILKIYYKTWTFVTFPYKQRCTIVWICRLIFVFVYIFLQLSVELVKEWVTITRNLYNNKQTNYQMISINSGPKM